MMDFSQGDMITIDGFHNRIFLIVSNNTFIRSTGFFHVCLIENKMEEGPLHIPVIGRNHTAGIAVCEQIKLIDPGVRACRVVDHIPYGMNMDVSDAIQGMFEYD